jgi:hypothetical protein
MMRQRVPAGVLGVLLLAWPAAAAAQPAADSPEGALAAYKVAVETGNLEATAKLTAGEAGAAFRKLAGPLAAAKAAADRLDQALQEKPDLNFKNPFAAGLAPLANLQLDVVEVTKEKDRILARVRFGPKGKAEEETVGVRQEGGVWRIDPPAWLGRQLRPLTTADRLDRQLKGLDKLTAVLDSLAKDIRDGKVKTKEEAVIRTVQLVNEANLGELLK